MKALKFIIALFLISVLASGNAFAQAGEWNCEQRTGTIKNACIGNETFNYEQEYCWRTYSGIFGNHFKQRGQIRFHSTWIGQESGDVYYVTYTGNLIGNHGMGKDETVHSWSSGGVVIMRKENGGVVLQRRTRFHFTTNANGEPTASVWKWDWICNNE